MKKTAIISGLLVLSALLSACAGGKTGTDTTTGTQPVTTAETKPETIMIKDPYDMADYVKFSGRTYIEQGATYFNWSLSGFEFNMVGTGAEALIVTNLGYGGSSPANNGMLYVIVDCDTENKKLLELDETSKWYTLAEGLGEGPHNIKVVKRTEVCYSTAGLEKLRINGEFAEKPATKELKLEFIGDSFTCGDGCYTVGGKDAYVSVNQDGTVSYAALIAEHYGAELNVTAHCGIGLVWNYAGKTDSDGETSMAKAYPYVDLFHKGDLQWNFKNYKSDLVVINLGTNDAQYVPRDKNLWINSYVEFLKTVRQKNPDAKILCTQGATNCSSPQYMCFDKIAKKAADEGLTDVYFYTMKNDYDAKTDGQGVGMHPSPAVHKKTADQLIAEIDRLGLLNK